MSATDDGGLTSQRWSWLRIAGTVASLALLAWMLSKQDWQELRGNVSGIPLPTLLVAFGLVFASQGCSSLRWWMLMRVQRIRASFLLAFRLYSAGLFASNFLPGTIGGDVIRIAGILPRSPDRVVGIASVVLDRAVGVTTMLLALPLSLATFGPLLGPLLQGASAAAFSPAGFVRRFQGAWRRLGDVLRPWLSRPQSLLGALLASMCGVLSYVTCVWIVARGLQIEVTPLDVAAVTGITYFLSQIPISINALGIREAAMIALYGQLGSTPEQAAALALITRALVMGSTIPGAFWLPGLMAAARSRPAREVL